VNVRAGEPHRSGLWPLAPLIVFALVSLTVGVVARNSNGVVDPSDYLQLFFTDPIHLKVWFASAAFVLACFQVATATAIYGRLRFLPTGPAVAPIHRWSGRLAIRRASVARPPACRASPSIAMPRVVGRPSRRR